MNSTFSLISFLEAEGLEKTYKFSQKDIANSTDISSASKVGWFFILYIW